MAGRNKKLAKTQHSKMRARPWCLRVGAWAAFLFAAAGASAPTSAEAADISQNSAIECQVTDGRGSINFGRSKHLGEAAGTQRFSPWVLAQDGVNLRDRIGLFWGPSASPAKSLRVAIDGPVSKPTQLISTIKETLVAVAVTSDQHTTRSWLITINFPQETVVVVGTSSGAVAVKAQVMVLSCTFNTQLAGKSAADSWRR